MAHCIYTPFLNFGFGIFTQAHSHMSVYIFSPWYFSIILCSFFLMLPGNQTPLVEFPWRLRCSSIPSQPLACACQYILPQLAFCIRLLSAGQPLGHLCLLYNLDPISAVVLSCLCGSGALGLFMCYDDQSLCAVLQASLFCGHW